MKTNHKPTVALSNQAIEEIKEIKREFQVERMVFFSDAVFAIVMTLMAIEIHLPETVFKNSNEQLMKDMLHLVPIIASYVISFFFIGMIWYRHLKLFAKVKYYDGGLVVRNLMLLGFIGLFPFASSLITHASAIVGTYAIYFVIVILCILTQQSLQHYLFVQRPGLLTDIPTKKEIKKVSADAIQVSALLTFVVFALICYHLIKNPEYKPFAMLLLLPILLVKLYLKRWNEKVTG